MNAKSLLLLTAVLWCGMASAAVAKPRPDLVVRAVSAPPASVQAGKGFEVTAMVANRGRRPAARSQLRFALVGGGNWALATRGMRALRPGKRARGRVAVTVPASLAPGVYRLSACADAARRVRERSERNNCRTARQAVTVVRPRVHPGTPPKPPGGGGPQPPDPAIPDPADVAPRIDPTVASTLGDTAAFLYAGADKVQLGVAPGTIQPRRVAVLRGRVTDREGEPIEGVLVTVLDHPELGRTRTRADGMYDLAVNGGGTLTLEFAKDGRLPAQRTLQTPWQDFAHVEDVALVAVDPHVTEIETGAGAPVQVARGSEVTDADGTRQATMIFDAGTTAEMELPNGSTRRIDDLEVRATEFTTGDSGPDAMPGALPRTSGYTYAAELSVDEALDAGATDVRFSKPVALYLENFLGFPVGGAVPTGYYDREKAEWVASENGRVVKVVAEAGGLADVDTDGNGTADNAGIDAAERGRLAGLYDAGQELWRVEITHFTPWDCNWPYGPPDDAVPPNGPTPHTPGSPPPGKQPDCDRGGSTIGCLNRTLGEGVEVVGTGYRLKYSSARAPGRAVSRTVAIPLSGPNVPPTLRRIQLEISVAGQLIRKTFAAAPNQSFTFVWDGRDAYGRPIVGEQRVTARIGFAYGAAYYPQPAAFARAFARVTRSGGGGTTIVGARDVTEVVLWRGWEGHVGSWDAGDADGLGGWTLDAHHSYSTGSRTLYTGDGGRRRADDVARVITAFAGRGEFGYSGDGGPATAARFGSPEAIATGPDGSVYISDTPQGVVRKVSPAGTITTVAGRGPCTTLPNCISGDGGPATQAQLFFPHGIAVAEDGTLFVADNANQRIRRVSPGGTITTIAGTGEDCLNGCPSNGDGGPATQARVTRPGALELAPDGSLYFIEQFTGRVRRIGPDGIVTTVAGGGNSLEIWPIPATNARLFEPVDLALHPDGSLYISEWTGNRVRRLTPDGMLVMAIGRGRGDGAGGGFFGGDGGPAKDADINHPYGLAIGRDGSVYVADMYNRRIRRAGPDGIITTIAGNGQTCGPTTTGFDCLDGAQATQARQSGARGIDVGPDGTLYVADAPYRIRKIAAPLPGFDGDTIAIASEDADALYLFDSRGRHLETIDALTGTRRQKFGYDGAGRLTTITDTDGRVTRIERNAAGAPTAILAPGGQRTELALDANGHLARIESPGGQAVTLTTTADGLLTGLTEPSDAAHTFEYDADGNLARDTGPAGAQTLTRSELPGGWSVALKSPTGRTTTFTVKRLPTGEVERSVADPGAGTTQTVEKLDGTTITTLPNGERIEFVEGPDPRFGMQAPIAASVKRTTPGGRTMTVTARRTVELADPTDVLSVVTQKEELTTGFRTTKTVYDAAARTLTATSPGGRASVRTYDAQGRLVRFEPAGGVTPSTFAYTAQGQLRQIAQGGRTITYAYDGAGRVASRTDAAGTATYAYDAADRLKTATLPGGRAYQFGYDAAGRRTSVTLPSGAVHAFAYSPAGDLTRVTPAGSAPYQRSLTGEGELAGVTLPGGRVQTYSRDGAGRLTGIGYDEAAAAFAVDNAGRPTAMGWTRGAVGHQLALAYDGDVVTSAAATGAATGTFAYDYDSELRLTGVQLDSGPKATLGYDADDLLTALGPFTLTRGGPGGRVSRIADGQRSEAVAYDARGRIASRTYALDGTDVYALAFEYDETDRMTERRERRGSGPVKTTTYAYDAAGRLQTVRVDGAITEAFTYNADGDRTSRRLPGGGTENAVYDARRQLDSRGTVDYTFDADGFLASRGAMTFTYGARGELLSAGGVTYAYDAVGRRVSRTAGGVTTEYLYGNPEHAFEVTATRGPGGLTRYFRDEGGHVFAFERGGERYLVATDQVGSATAIVDASGAVVKAMSYDSFGVQTSDSDPAFAYAFGFAGGLADATTGLVRFGMRDYDPESGRWTARDSSLDSTLGGNLYAYVGNDPANRADPVGLWSISLSAYGGVGGGIKLSFARRGFSWCGELGVGAGGTAELDFKSGLDADTMGVFGEAKADVLGLASLKLKGEVTNPCGHGAGPRDGDYDVKFTPEACLAFACTNFDNVKVKGSTTPKFKFKPEFKPAIGLSAKAGAKVCSQITW
jgi:RHS repeat-associated protein